MTSRKVLIDRDDLEAVLAALETPLTMPTSAPITDWLASEVLVAAVAPGRRLREALNTPRPEPRPFRYAPRGYGSLGAEASDALNRLAFRNSLASLRNEHGDPVARKANSWPDAWLCATCRHPFILHEPWYSHRVADEMGGPRLDPSSPCAEGCGNCWSDLVTP